MWTLIGGDKYAVKAVTPLVVQNWVAMKDPAVWGEDAQVFRPDRMMNGKFEALPVCFLVYSSLFQILKR